MKTVWHTENPEDLRLLRCELEQKYPDLCLQVVGEFVVLAGGFPVIYEGIELDRFQIRVIIPHDFPETIPAVRELGGRVPHTADWHTYDKGTLCIVVPEEWLINPSAASVTAFLDGPVRNYFIAHALAEAGMKRPMGERDHGTSGLLDAYGEMVGSDNPDATRQYLMYLAHDRVKGHWDCPCGSKKRLRNCHMQKILGMQQKIPARIAASALKRLKDQAARELANRVK